MDMEQNLLKFSGHINLPRSLNKKLLLGEITFEEFSLLLIYVMNADWDSRHKGYSMVYLPNIYLGKKVSGLDRNKVARIKKSLIAKKFIEELDNPNGGRMIKILGYDKYQTKVDWAMKKIVNDLVG